MPPGMAMHDSLQTNQFLFDADRLHDALRAKFVETSGFVRRMA